LGVCGPSSFIFWGFLCRYFCFVYLSSSCFELSWVMSRRVVDLFACWWSIDSTWSAAMWKMMFSCILWYLWKEINDRIFFRTTRECWRSLSLFSSMLFIIGQLHLYLLSCLVFMIFLFFSLLLVRCFSYILPMYLTTWLCFVLLMISGLLIKKK
jgi:hypothetical protein